MLLDHSSEHYTRNEFLWWNLDDFSWHLGKTTTTTACKRMSRHEYNKSYGAWICFCSYFVFFYAFKRRDATLQKAKPSFHRIAKCVQFLFLPLHFIQNEIQKSHTLHNDWHTHKWVYVYVLWHCLSSCISVMGFSLCFKCDQKWENLWNTTFWWVYCCCPAVEFSTRFWTIKMGECEYKLHQSQVEWLCGRKWSA